ncbi:MAG TPA: class I poly(R)-hydroxyalkanoic acid synthase [Chloroflexia bacterium]|nr:class I poly(R)-hydroxyalkanoic acid synthase [Chloroflexia bacterium]
MADSIKQEPENPFMAWNEFIQTTLGANPVTQAASTVSFVRNKAKDPWLNLVEQLWQTNPSNQLLSLDPKAVTEAFQQLWANSYTNALRAWNNYSQFLQQYAQLMTGEMLKALGTNQKVEPVVKPEKNDKRFNAPDWQQHIVFDSIKQSYLLAATYLLKTTAEMRGLDQKQQHKLVFYLRQFLDAISPTNFVFTNPQVIHETVQSGGQNLVTGMTNLLRDIRAGQIKMTDTDAFKPGQNLAITPGQVIYRNRLIELIQYSPTTSKVYETPILFVPHWINKYYILDLQPQNSMAKFLLDQGFTVFVISWKNPDTSMEDITFEDYLTLGPLTALDIVKKVSGSEKVNMVGYCIGGTLLSMAVPYLNATGDHSVNSASFFVSLQDFSEVGDTEVFVDEPQLALIEGQMKGQGYLDSRQMANMFNMLRDNDLIWSNVVNNYLLGKEPPAFDLLYWNADGTRMAPLAHSFYMHNTYLENNLVKPGKIVLKGIPIDLNTITQDVYAVAAEQDHIVPWKSAWRITRLTGGKVRFVIGGSGHIAGVINSPEKGRGYWTNDKKVATADEWFEGAVAHKGSWWSDWAEWLKERSGKEVDPPTIGNDEYKSIIPAPGTYVLEK